MIEPVTAEDRAGMDAWLALLQAARAHDVPSLPPLSAQQHAARFDWPGQTLLVWVVREDSGDTEVVGAAELSLPQRDNRDTAFAYVAVAPHRRRRGVGRRLLGHLALQARAAGRVLLVTWAMDPADGPGPGSAFLRAAGARLVMTEVRSRLALPAADPPAWHELATAARRAADGYALVQWTGPTPEPWLADIAALTGRMMTDAPMGDLRLEPQQWDTDRVRERDAAEVASGMRSVVTAARAPDGHLAAFTTAFTDAGRERYASQGDTLVAPAHRGRRLGLWIKLANVDLLRTHHPAVRSIDTYNADDNRYMRAINDALGFVPLYRQGDWKLDLQAGTTAPMSAAASGP